MFIYKITNIKTNKIYIGFTIENPKERLRKHFLEVKSGSSTYLHNSMRKHGKDNFITEQIDIANCIEELKQKEIEYIKKFNTRDRKIDGYRTTNNLVVKTMFEGDLKIKGI